MSACGVSTNAVVPSRRTRDHRNAVAVTVALTPSYQAASATPLAETASLRRSASCAAVLVSRTDADHVRASAS